MSSGKFFFIGTPLSLAGYKGSVTLGGLFDQEACTAHGAGFGHGLFPHGESAFWIPAAPVKGFAPFGCFFDQLPVATRFRALDPCFLFRAFQGNGSSVLALRITAAGQEIPVFSLFDEHGATAFFTCLIRRFSLVLTVGPDPSFFVTDVISRIGACRVSITG